MVLPIIARAVAGLAQLTFGAIGQIGNIAGATTVAIGSAYKSLSSLVQQFQVFAQSAKGAYEATIGANEKLNQSLLKSQIILSGVTDVYDGFGNKIDRISDKITAFKGPLGEARRQLEKDTLELVGVTSELTFNVFDKVLRQFGTLQGQSKGFKTDIEAITALSKNLTAALGTFGLTDVVQIEQEIRSLLTGDYSNPDSILNKSLGLSKEDRAKARSEGKEVQYILSKTQDAVVGNQLGADSLTNTLSNIKDTVEIFLRDISGPLGDILSKELQTLNTELKKILGDPEFKEQAGDFFLSLVNGAISLGKGIIAIGQFLSDIGIVSLAGMIAQGIVSVTDLIGRLFQMLGDLSKWIQEKIIRPFTDFATGIWKKLTDPIGELGEAIKNIPMAELLVNSDSYQKLREDMKNPIKIPWIPAILPRDKLDEDFKNQLENTYKRSLAFNRKDFVVEEKKAIKAFAENSGVSEDQVIGLRNEGYSFSKIRDEVGDKNSTLGKLGTLATIEGEALIGPVESRLKAIQSIQNLDLDKDTRELVNKLADLEKKAGIDNTAERKQLTTRIITKITNSEDLNREANQYLENIRSLEESIANAKNTGASASLIDEFQAELKKAQDFAKENSLEADLIILPKLAPDKGSLKTQLKETVNSAVSSIANSEDTNSVNSGLDSLIKVLPEAIKAGAITENQADKIFSNLIKSQKLSYNQLSSIQGVYTNTLKDESSKRMAILQMEEDTVSAKYAQGLISKPEKDKDINEYATLRNLEERKILETQLGLALAKSEGLENQETQSFRVQIGSNLAKGAIIDAQSVSIKYSADFKDIEKANYLLTEASSKSKELRNQNILRLQSSGAISESDKDIKDSVGNINEINNDIGQKRKEIGDLGKLTPGLNEEEIEANRKLISEKRLQLLQLQTSELQAQLALIDKLFNKELANIEKRSSKSDNLQQQQSLRKRILDLSLKNSDVQLGIETKINRINSILTDISQSEEKILSLRKLEAETKDQQIIKEEKISQEVTTQLSLKGDLLEVEREILGSLTEIDDKERENRISELNNQLQAIKNERELLALRRELGLIKTTSEKISDIRSKTIKTEKDEKGAPVKTISYEEAYSEEIKTKERIDPISGKKELNLDSELEKYKPKGEILADKVRVYNDKYGPFNGGSEDAKQLAKEIAILEAEIAASKKVAAAEAEKDKAAAEAKAKAALEEAQISESERIAQKIKEIETLENKLGEIDLKIRELEIAKQIAKIESDASIAKLEGEKAVLNLTLERLKAEGKLSPEAESAANSALSAIDKQISLSNKSQNLSQENAQNQINTYKQAQTETGGKLETERNNLQTEINNGLDTVAGTSFFPEEALNKIKAIAKEEVTFNAALKSGQTIIDIGTNLTNKSNPPIPPAPAPVQSVAPSIDNSTNSQDTVTVVNNFPTYSEERNAKRLLGL